MHLGWTKHKDVLSFLENDMCEVEYHCLARETLELIPLFVHLNDSPWNILAKNRGIQQLNTKYHFTIGSV